MRAAHVFVGFAFITIILFVSAFPARAVCKSSRPEDMLDCLKWAYADRDSAAYGSLLSPDFKCFNYGPDSSAIDRTISVLSAWRLFTRTDSLRLDFLDGWKVHSGDSTGTWVVDSLDARISLKPTAAANKPPIVNYSRRNTLYLRLISSPEAHLVIWKWVRAI